MAIRNPNTLDENPNPIQEGYNEGFDALSAKQTGRTGVYANSPEAAEARQRRNDEQEGTEDIASQEKEAGTQSTIINNFTGKKSHQGNTGRLTGRQKKGIAGATTGLVGLIIGIVSFFSVGLGPIAFFANVTLDLDDTIGALQDRMSKLRGAKIRPGNATSLGCSRFGSNLPVKCKYVTMSEKMKQRYKDAGIEITGETRFGSRIKPTEFTFRNQTYTPDQFMNEIRSRPQGELAKAVVRSHSVQFLGLSGPNFVNKTLRKWGLTKRPPQLQGTVDDRARALMNRTGGGTVQDNIVLVDAVEADGETPIYNDDGSRAKQLPGDPGGDLVTQDDLNKVGDNFTRINSIDKPITRGVLGGVNILGWYDTACSIAKAGGQAAIGVKVLNAAQLAEYAMPLASLTHALKAGNYIENEDAEALQKAFYDTDARRTIANIVEGDKIEEVPNPDYGKNAMDSELYKMSVNGGVASTSIVDTRYSLGFGINSLARKTAAFSRVAHSTIDLGSLNGCDIAQSWWGRAGGFAAGILLGGLSFGSATAASISANAALIIASFFIDDILNAILSDNLINDTMDEAPVERGSAVWSGMAAIHSQHALSRGMMPGSAEDIMAYQGIQNQARQEYIAYERESSRPLDINNPFSITGSIALALQSHFPSSLSSTDLTSMTAKMSSFVFNGFSSTLKPSTVHAANLNPERFKQCDDTDYRNLGIDADVQCNVRYVMPEESMRLEPLEVAQWMEDQGYVEPDTTTGFPKGYSPPDPSESHNLAKSFILGIIDEFYNTRQYENDFSKFLDFCVYRALPFGETYDENGAYGDADPEWKSGKKCLDTNAEEINYFRMYVFDMSVNDDLDESPIVGEINCGPFGSNSGGAVGPKMTQKQLEDLIPEWGLPTPQAEAGGGAKGYKDYLKQLEEKDNAGWAAQQMLNGEKQYKQAGGEIVEYLTTGWLWFENGGDWWPDPYQINCDDPGYRPPPAHDEVGKHCRPGDGVNFQASGYRPIEKKDKYIEVYNKLYSESELTSVLNRVVENSRRASKPQWDYHSDEQSKSPLVSRLLDGRGSVTLDDISPNASDFFNEETQFYSLMLGKDPAMAAGMNSFAVSESDLINALRGSGYGYIGPAEKQVLSNMIMALYLFDGQGPSDGASCAVDTAGRGVGEGIEAVWGGIGDKDLSYGFKSVPAGGADPSWYSYGEAFGLSGTEHTGTDIPMEPYDPVYSPVEGIVVCERNGVGPGGGEGGPRCAGAGDLSQEDPNPGSVCNLRASPIKPRGAGTVMIKITKNGQETGDLLVLGHLSDSLVKVDDKVTPNQQIGVAGCMNGWHVHVEYYKKTATGFELVDPVEHL